jgi:O-acetylhomoserine/O-acetylserine sulfhydrylase-like pyridoxal-dependent enzyme
MDTIIQSAEYQLLSKRVSPHLLLLHQLTSGQELIPSVTPSSRTLFQLAIETHIQQEFPPETFLLQHQTSADFQTNFTQPISSSDSKSQILQTEINYLQKQHAEAIAIGDFTQQLAAERAISNKLQIIEYLEDKQKSLKISQTQIPDHSTIENQESTISEKSLIANQVDQQIRGLLKKHVKLLRKRIRNDKQTIHSVEDLRQLSISPLQKKNHKFIFYLILI